MTKKTPKPKVIKAGSRVGKSLPPPEVPGPTFEIRGKRATLEEVNAYLAEKAREDREAEERRKPEPAVVRHDWPEGVDLMSDEDAYREYLAATFTAREGEVLRRLQAILAHLHGYRTRGVAFNADLVEREVREALRVLGS